MEKDSLSNHIYQYEFKPGVKQDINYLLQKLFINF